MTWKALGRRTEPLGPILRTALVVGGTLAAAVATMTWVSLQHSVRLVPTELYILVVAIVFTLAGIWAGHAFTARPSRLRRLRPGAFRHQ